MGDDEPEQCIGDPSTSDPATRSPSGASRGELGVASSGSRDVQTAKGDQLPTCYFSVGTEHDDGYSDNDDESIADRLDFTRLKVQGREEQIDRLLKMYSFVQRRGLGRRMNIQKGQTSVAIVSGTSGTGKSTLVKHFVDRLRMQSAQPGRPCMPFFIDGKYEELAGADPFSGLVDAFNGFAQELMEGDADEITRIRDCIRGQLGSEATTLTAVIPGLKAVIQDETAVTGSRENARNKLKYIFQTFVSAISTKQRPVIMFLDDLQWCDSASLDLIVALLTDLDMRYFMFIGSYRADEVGQNDALHQCLEVVNNIQPLERIELTNLSKDKLNLMVLDALQRDEASETMELTEVIYKWTMGNIFHSVQILEELQRKRILSFSRLTFQWEWELKGAELENVLSDDVIQVVTGKISDAHPDLQRILVLAAYTRMGVDVDTLAHLTIINGPPLSPDHLIKMLDKAVVEGLLTNNVGSRFYSFGHDRIQEAAYGMIPPGKERDDLRLRLGLKLYEMGMAESGEDWMLFAAADHLNATALQLKSEDPFFLIKVNLEVADRASAVAAYQYSTKYLGMARKSLHGMDDPWEAAYEITLRVYRATADTELCLGRFDVGMGFGQKVISRSRCLDDMLPTHLAICRAVGREERHKEAFDMSMGILQTMGAIPKRFLGLRMTLIKDYVYVKSYFAKHSDTEILALPLLNNKRLEIIMELFYVASYHAYYCGAMLDFLTAILSMVVLSFKNGISPYSGTAMMGYSLFSNAVNDMQGAHRFSHLARAILTKTQARELECLQIFTIAHFVYAWKVPTNDLIELYDNAHKIGMESGDFENALLSQVAGYHHAFVAGHSLAHLETKFSSTMEKLNLYNIQSVRGMAVEQLLPIQYLRGTSSQPYDARHLAKFGPTGKVADSSESFRLMYGYLGRLQLAVYFNDDHVALQYVAGLALLAEIEPGFCVMSGRLCFSCLAYGTLYRKGRKRSYLRKGRRCLRELKGMCKSKGTTCWHRCLLMEAHLLASEGRNPTTVRAAYDHAIGAASRSGHDHDAALGCQLAAEFGLSVMRKSPSNTALFHAMEEMVRRYLEQARELYKSWGAIALINHLEQTHPHFLDRGYWKRPSSTEPLSLDHSHQSSQSDTDKITSLPDIISDASRQTKDETKEDISVLTME